MATLFRHERLNMYRIPFQSVETTLESLHTVIGVPKNKEIIFHVRGRYYVCCTELGDK